MTMHQANAGSNVAMSDLDVHLFNEGTHYRLYEHLGAHLCERDGASGVRFAVWAPNGAEVSVVGDFNGWTPGADPMRMIGGSGVWEGFVAGLGKGEKYKFHIRSHHRGYEVMKTDPFGYRQEVPPDTASVVWDLEYSWGDGEWMGSRAERQTVESPISIYELHLGSWMRPPDREFHTYRELAEKLPAYVKARGFTHVEFMPVMEHPLYRSWGYQSVGYFAPTSRYGSAQDLMALIDVLHQEGIGVILDWVPSHFPSDEHGLGYFDGTHLFEHEDPRLGFHPDWKSLIFNYGRHEVRAFLISSACFWLDKFHADGIRVDAVASMLYRDYSREDGEWIPNDGGGRENDEAIDFLRRFNTEVYRSFTGVQTYAEESTAWPLVSKPVYDGGLGFGFKWDMGWMHDTLQYLEREPVHRRWHHGELTFRSVYMFAEHYTLPLSHDEVVHGKGSLVGKMPGDEWRRMANTRLLFLNQWTQPGKKLLFMGGEMGQIAEWNEELEIGWELLAEESHLGLQRLVDRLNAVYRQEKALHELDSYEEGHQWVEADDAERSMVAFLRKGRGERENVLCVLNYEASVWEGARFGVPFGGEWEVLVNTDAAEFGGSGAGSVGRVSAREGESHGQPWFVDLDVPALGGVVLKPV